MLITRAFYTGWVVILLSCERERETIAAWQILARNDLLHHGATSAVPGLTSYQKENEEGVESCF